MPLYDYKCDDCEHTFEVRQSFDDDKLIECPQCNKQTLRRLFSVGNVIVGGSDFSRYKKNSDRESASKDALFEKVNAAKKKGDLP